ncbi:hypothetical protein JTE90_019242 [Oedothorax gibbosus]|uniref:Uncharacterized protein n=1 Tax=Oedothorax gibbosus TaxID=931172 RepID=A0AAV6URT7_9ARAC|nr:hypothetical protein JTE90_019242 [Oedothorax gibbosus]
MTRQFRLYTADGIRSACDHLRVAGAAETRHLHEKRCPFYLVCPTCVNYPPHLLTPTRPKLERLKTPLSVEFNGT